MDNDGPCPRSNIHLESGAWTKAGVGTLSRRSYSSEDGGAWMMADLVHRRGETSI